MLGKVAREAADLGAELREGLPPRRGELRLGAGESLHLLGHAPRAALGDAREPLELRLRQPERLADIADRTARAVCREARHEGRVLVAVALDHRHDELLADVAREVEVDVRDGDELAVQEAAERETGGDRVDMGEPGQIADDRADRASPASPRWQEMARRAGPAHL